jgi:hypothetical protein
MTPEIIQSIYGLDTHIIHHPDSGRPLVLVRRSDFNRQPDEHHQQAEQTE